MVILVFQPILLFSLSYFFLKSLGMVKTPMLSSSLDLFLWVDREVMVETSGFPLSGPEFDLSFGIGWVKRIGLVETIYCLKSSYFIIILMKSLCCLLKYGVNPQISLLIHSLHIFKVYSLGFLIQYSKQNPSIQ